MGTEAEELDRDALIEKNLPLVGYQVAELLRRVPSFVQREDLASAGALALVQAANSYDPTHGVPFHRFAVYRIRGAMLDELRSMDWATRGARQRTKQLEEMTATLTAAAGRAPTKEELASALGVEVEQVESAQADASRRIVSIDSTVGEDDTRTIEIVDEGMTPEDSLLTDERMVYLKAAVQSLPQRLRFVVEQIFFAEKPISEIADALGVTQSRVSQLRTEALSMMREGMEHHLESEPNNAVGKGHKEKAGIVQKRREKYFQKIADNAESIREPGGSRPSGGRTTSSSPSLESGSPNGTSINQSAEGKTSSSKSSTSSLWVSDEPSGQTEEKEPPSTASENPPRGSVPKSQGRRFGKFQVPTSSTTTSFLADRSKVSAQAKAQLRAEAEARAAEEEERKSKDKEGRGSQIAEQLPNAKEEPGLTPPTASYLGGLSMKRHETMVSSGRKPRK